AKTEAEARAIFTSKGMSLDGFRQDEDVLDTWASSWLWPISVFNGMKDPKSADIEYYYPTQVLVTAPEILFFWVARMIIAGYEYRNEKPFSDVYLTGIVRDKLRRKMSKSLGNSPDPLDLIAQYGADAIRMGILLCSPAGNDIIYDDKLIEQGRNFNNKLWNVLRLIKGWEVTETSQTKNEAAIQWFDSKLNDTINTINDHFEQFRISDALMCLYNFIWDDFCSWYLEFIKPEFGQPIDSITYEKTIDFFEGCLKLLHPYMPFITEEIWHLLRDRKAGDDIVITQLNDAGNINNNILASGNEAKELISRIRDIRAKNNVSPKVAASLYAEGDITSMQAFRAVIMKMANLEVFESVTGDVKNAVTFLVGTQKFFVVVQMEINIEDERKKLEEQIAYQKGFLLSIDKKLSNEKFVGSAPAAVVDLERRKKADAEEKIRILEESLRNLGN
ncbi:MAG TPA: class I tRNA ligase family protein, partial [Chitinophagales bacterium]|nr:class I tRNA ligase family protein [Chitinophagales bacterium]